MCSVFASTFCRNLFSCSWVCFGTEICVWYKLEPLEGGEFIFFGRRGSIPRDNTHLGSINPKLVFVLVEKSNYATLTSAQSSYWSSQCLEHNSPWNYYFHEEIFLISALLSPVPWLRQSSPESPAINSWALPSPGNPTPRSELGCNSCQETDLNYANCCLHRICHLEKVLHAKICRGKR